MYTWEDFIKLEFSKEYFKELSCKLSEEYKKYTIFPEKRDIFNAYKLTPIDKVKVVILGQDPYINKDQAHGLSFSILNNNVKIPPSLKNIFLELQRDVGVKRTNYNLSDWGRQGVLLLNSILTVREGESLSHKDLGWEVFTDNTIRLLNKLNKNIIFVFWGKYAQSKSELIGKNNSILSSSHPSPFSFHRGFWGSNVFSNINKLLKKYNKKEIVW